jgi:hypothetical protein
MPSMKGMSGKSTRKHEGVIADYLIDFVASRDSWSQMQPRRGVPPGTVVPTGGARAIVDNDSYELNQTRINYLQQVLDQWKATNEQGHNNYVKLRNEMTRRVQLGEQAK